MSFNLKKTKTKAFPQYKETKSTYGNMLNNKPVSKEVLKENKGGALSVYAKIAKKG